MGRSAGDSGDIDPSDLPEDSAGEVTASRASIAPAQRAIQAAQAAQKQMLENVRRALGKLVSHTKIGSLPVAAIAPKANLVDHRLLDIDPAPGTRGDLLAVLMTDRSAGIPEAVPGGGGVDLATVVTIVSANSALGESSIESYPVEIDYTQTQTTDLPMWTWGVQEPGISSLNTVLDGGEIHRFSLDRVRDAAIGRLPVDPLRAAPGAGRSIANAMRPVRITVHSSFSHAYRAPMRRQSIIPRRGAGLNTAERERLAAAAKTSLENVALIGLFRNVPVTAVSRLSVEEEAAELSIWLKPEAVGAPAAPLMVSLLIGRDIATGKMIQTVAG